jgi:hypothetical protein
MYFPSGSISLILPVSTSCRTATAVNILFIDPMRKRVSRVLGIFFSRSANPIGAAEENLGVLRHQHGASEPVGGNILFDPCFDRRDSFALGQPRNGKRGRARDSHEAQRKNGVRVGGFHL